MKLSVYRRQVLSKTPRNDELFDLLKIKAPEQNKSRGAEKYKSNIKIKNYSRGERESGKNKQISPINMGESHCINAIQLPYPSFSAIIRFK